MAKNKSTSTPLALELLGNKKGVDEKAQFFFESSQRNIQRDILDQLGTKIQKLKDSKFDLENFSLESDKNADVTGLTREAVEYRFKQLLEIDYQITLAEQELKIKTASFDKYFK